MFKTFKRLFSGAPQGWSAVQQWAQQAGHVFKRSRDGSGFVVEVGSPGVGARVEWGPSHRSYISGHELRIRCALGAGPNLQMLILSKPLMELLETQVYEQFAEGTKTRIDRATPQETRWLVLYTKLPASELRALRDSFGAVANVPQAASLWLDGALGEHLAAALSDWLDPASPLALIVHRSRLTLRSALSEPDAERIAALVELFDVARREARRVADQWNWGAGNASTQPSLFSPQPELRGQSKR